MALTLIDPSAASITTLDSGVIAVRLADFLGPARGTLTTAVDADAAAGTVVLDSQTIAVQTTFTSASVRWALAADTCRVPFASLDLESGWRYEVVVGYRITGEAPSNAQARSSWASYYGNDGAGPAVAWGTDNTFRGVCEWLPRAIVEQYLLHPAMTPRFAGVTGTNLTLRAWGITGGTIEVRLDALYLVPESSSDDNRWQDEWASSFDMKLLANGIVSGDDDSAGQWIGVHSVLRLGSIWANDLGSVDFQEAENEPTAKNVQGNGDWDFGSPYPDDPPSYLTILAGSTHIDAITLITEGFDTAFVPATSVVAYDVDAYVATANGGNSFANFWDQPTDMSVNWGVAGGIATCWIPANQGAGTFAPNRWGAGGWPRFRWGVSTIPTGGGSSLDPRNYRKTLTPHFQCGIMEAKVRFQDELQGVFNLGMERGSVGDSLCGAALELTAGADLELRLGQWQNGVAYSTFVAAVNVGAGYALGTWWRLKVEKRGYNWRAKAWVDGGAEPGWQVEGHEALTKATTGTGFVAYPYDDNWPLSVNNDSLQFDPRGNWGQFSDAFTIESRPVMWCGVDASLPRMRIEVDEMNVSWDPGSGTIDDMSVSEENYDGSEYQGSVVVPYGAHRLIDAGFRKRRFNNDTNGYNLYAWKASGTPPLLTAGLSKLWERAPFRRFRPQIYRRPFG